MVEDWSEVPERIRRTFDELGIPKAEQEALGGVGAQYDSELVYHRVREAVASEGVIYLGLEEALRDKKYEKMVREHFMQLVHADEHKFMALHGAVWSGGSFVYVPPFTAVSLPLQAYYRMNAPRAGQFEHTLIIVDEGATLEFIEGCSAPKYNEASLHAGCVEIFVGKGAKMRYITVENWSKNVYNLNTKRAIVAEKGEIEWITGSFGSKVSMLYPMGVLDGDNAKMRYVGVSLAGSEQELDTGVKVLHRGRETRSIMRAKSLANNGGINRFRSIVTIEKSATRAKSLTDCASLMLDSISETETIPEFNVKCSSAEAAHEASVGNISEENLRYLAERGIDEDRGRSLVVQGFLEEVVKELPVEYAVEMNRLMRLEIEGNL